MWPICSPWVVFNTGQSSTWFFNLLLPPHPLASRIMLLIYHLYLVQPLSHKTTSLLLVAWFVWFNWVSLPCSRPRPQKGLRFSFFSSLFHTSCAGSTIYCKRAVLYLKFLVRCTRLTGHRPVPLPLLTTYLNLQQNALTHDGYLSRINLERNVFCLTCFVSNGPSSWSFLCKGKFVSYLAHCSKLACFTYRNQNTVISLKKDHSHRNMWVGM